MRNYQPAAKKLRNRSSCTRPRANYFFGLAEPDEKLGNARTRRASKNAAPLQVSDAPIVRRYLAMAAS